MKQIMQFRYEGFRHKNNYPQFSDYDAELISKNIFRDYRLVSQLGIQGPPGLRFYLNEGANPITIGKTGIYELDLEHIGRIFSIRFDSQDIKNMFNKDQSNRLIIDIVYDGG